MDDVKALAEKYLGVPITQEIYVKKLETVSQKLQWIISREGDDNGARLNPDYKAQLIAEAIRSDNFAYRCVKHFEDKKRAALKRTTLNANLIIAQTQ